MNQTTKREAQARSLARRITHAHTSAARYATERDQAVREYGIAHPRAIEVSRRLVHAQSAERALLLAYRVAASDNRRISSQDRSRRSTPTDLPNGMQGAGGRS